MLKRLLFVLVALYFVRANHIGYIGLYDNAHCNGDPYFISPILPGVSRFCSANHNTCIASLQGITQPNSVNTCENVDYQLNESSTGLLVTKENEIQPTDVTFYNCTSSSTFAGCFVKYIPESDRFIIRGDSEPKDPEFVTFLDYLQYQTCNQLESRIPIFDGISELCSLNSTSCTSILTGVIHDPNDENIECTRVEFERDSDCSVTYDEENEPEKTRSIGVCYKSDFFIPCQFQFSSGEDRLTVPCANNNPFENSSSSSSDESSSSSTLFINIFYSFIFSFLLLC